MVCKVCGKNQFIGHQIIRADILVNGEGEFDGNLPEGLESHIYDAERPYGPFTCVCCGAEYDELTENAHPLNFHKDDSAIWIKDDKQPIPKIDQTNGEIEPEGSILRFGVDVIEILKRTIIVRAGNLEEAIQRVENSVEEEEIVLTDRDYNGREIEASKYWSGGKVPDHEDVSGYWNL